MLSFREWLRETFGFGVKPRLVKTKEDIAHIAKKSSHGEVKVLINHDTGRVHAWPGEDADHATVLDTIRKPPKKVSGGTIYHDGKEPTAEHSEWSSLDHSDGEAFYGHPPIDKYKKRDDY